MTQLSVLVCCLVADMVDEPPVQSTVVACDGCGRALWRALSSPKNVARVWCYECAYKDIDENNPVIHVERPNPVQRAEFEEVTGHKFPDDEELVRLFNNKWKRK